MKKALCITVLLVAIPAFVFAATKSVTINWTMSDTTDVIGYKMYYSYNSDMTPKVLACETNDSNASSLTCANIGIDTYPIYFVIIAMTTDAEYSSTVKPYPPIIEPVQNFRVFLLGAH